MYYYRKSQEAVPFSFVLLEFFFSFFLPLLVLAPSRKNVTEPQEFVSPPRKCISGVKTENGSKRKEGIRHSLSQSLRQMSSAQHVCLSVSLFFGLCPSILVCPNDNWRASLRNLGLSGIRQRKKVSGFIKKIYEGINYILYFPVNMWRYGCNTNKGPTSTF